MEGKKDSPKVYLTIEEVARNYGKIVEYDWLGIYGEVWHKGKTGKVNASLLKVMCTKIIYEKALNHFLKLDTRLQFQRN